MKEKGSSASPGRSADTPTGQLLSDAAAGNDVIAYLERHPGLLAEHPELFDMLARSTRSAGNVVDLQQYLVDRLREENRKLRDAYRAIVATARYNRAAQAQVHDGILQVLSAGSFENLIHAVTTELPLALEVDAVVICLESGDAPIPRAYAAGLRSLSTGAVDRHIGADRSIQFASDIVGDDEIFGPAAGLIRSHALARLHISERAPKGLLAIGARTVDAFHQSQGTELVSFLTQILEVAIRQWLKRPL